MDEKYFEDLERSLLDRRGGRMAPIEEDKWVWCVTHADDTEQRSLPMSKTKAEICCAPYKAGVLVGLYKNAWVEKA